MQHNVTIIIPIIIMIIISHFNYIKFPFTLKDKHKQNKKKRRENKHKNLAETETKTVEKKTQTKWIKTNKWMNERKEKLTCTACKIIKHLNNVYDRLYWLNFSLFLLLLLFQKNTISRYFTSLCCTLFIFNNNQHNSI